jgi:large subunit ribosomal protein L7Ae
VIKKTKSFSKPTITQVQIYYSNQGLEGGNVMAPPIFVRFEMPKDLVNKTYEIIEMARDSGKVRKGSNEVTKLIERSQAKFVVMAEDTKPEELLAHLPLLCEEKNIPYAYVPSKQELGSASGLDVPTAAVAVLEYGKSKILIESLMKKLSSKKGEK